jgi:hypothetical protein
MAAAVVLLGCGQKEEPPATDGTNAPGSAQTEPRTTAGPAIEPGRKLKETAQVAVEQATAQAQALIDQTKALLSEQKYAEAASGLEKLAGMSLTPEQQAMVAELKVEAGKVGQAIEGDLSEIKNLVAEKKYQEASAKLAELADVKLTPEQEHLVE